MWAINWGNKGGPGNVTLIDPDDPDNFDTTCCDTIVSSYTYSDMTGVQLEIATAPSGQYEMIAEGCMAPALTGWSRIELDADVPAGSGLRIEVRTAETMPELSDTAWFFAGEIPPGASPLDLRAAFDAAGLEFDYTWPCG